MNLTKKRIELLQAVADGAVSDQYSIGLGWFVEWDRGPAVTNGRRHVRATHAIQLLHGAGLIRISRPNGDWQEPRHWELTRDGRTALEANGGRP